MKNWFLLTAFLLAQFGSIRAESLALVNGWIIDGVGGTPFAGSLIVRDGRIESVLRGGDPIPEVGEMVDLGGRYVLPGLIDAHVHIGNAAAARTALHSGVTTVRSMGVGHFSDVGLRELVRQGALEGPEILAAGYHIRPEPARELFLDEPGLGDLMGGLHSPEAYARVARAILDRGVDVLKVVATDRAGLPDTDPRRQIMSREEIAAVVREGAQRGVAVAAHAHGDEGARAAVEAGVRSIEHGTYLSTATLTLMKERGTAFVPTLAVVKDLILPGGDYDNAVLQIRGRHMFPRLCAAVREARRLGVEIVSATDTGYGPESVVRLPHDIEELTHCGLSADEAIQAATSGAARLLGIGGRTGAVAPGLEADLIVVEGDPRQDIVRLQDVLVVVSDGRIALNRLPR